jgi:hypothetical protein
VGGKRRGYVGTSAGLSVHMHSLCAANLADSTAGGRLAVPAGVACMQIPAFHVGCILFSKTK